MGTNVGSKLLTGGNEFLISEGEWGRLIGELGPLFGLLAIAVRLSFCMQMAWACYKKVLVNDFLPWLLFSFGFIIFLQGQWAQPTTLGFATFVAGLILALFKPRQSDPV